MSDAPLPATVSGEILLLLQKIEQVDVRAADQILPLVYEELCKLAATRMAPKTVVKPCSPPRQTSEW